MRAILLVLLTIPAARAATCSTGDTCTDDGICQSLLGSNAHCYSGCCLECQSDSDCPANRNHCNNLGLCEFLCSSDSDCASGYRCARNGQCLSGGCSSNNDCGSSQKCASGSCVTGSGCGSNVDCPSGFTCQSDGSCSTQTNSNTSSSSTSTSGGTGSGGSGSTTSGSTTSGSGGGSGPVDSSQCNDCAAAAQMAGCAGSLTACQNDASCAAVAQCLYNCSDSDCQQSCNSQASPQAMVLLNNILSCECAQCAAECAASCAGTSSGGSSGTTGGANLSAQGGGSTPQSSGCDFGATSPSASALWLLLLPLYLRRRSHAPGR